MHLVIANAGTPLIWAAMAHFLLGNFLLGILEGVLLSCISGVDRRRAATLMVIANYLSAFAGMMFITGWIGGHLQIDLYNVQRVTFVLYLIAYLVTLLLEWPLVFAALKGTQWRLRRSVAGTLVVQTATCLILFVWYALASTTPTRDGWRLIPTEQLALPPGVVVYYINAQDGDVYRAQGRGQVEKVAELDSNDWRERLYFAAAKDEPVAALRSTGGEPLPAITAPAHQVVPEDSPDDTWFTFGLVPTLGEIGSKRAYTGFWPAEGLRVQGERFAVNHVYLQWGVRNATWLPDGRILLQLGDDQICVVDPQRKEAGILLRGRGPAPVLLQADGQEPERSAE